ncbi:MAG: CDP-alcohol phosphatidyltransferase family protein [Planctomycetota bacterium]|nr:CDP-alcohol phosphatidyltransferase family protein [Planctomycetota bacterium]
MAALRFRRFRDGRPKPKRRFLMGVHPVPTLVTLGNLLCGFAAIILAMRSHNPPQDFYGFSSVDCLYTSALLIFVAMVFDAMDGRVARWTKSASKFGMEMDSLCDVVSFGVAPAVLVKALIDYEAPKIWAELGAFPILDRYVWLMMATYVCCAALRLARYNVEAETGHRDFFFGIPSPAAAGCVASLVIMLIPMLKASPATEKAPIYAWIGIDNFPSIIYATLYALPFLMLCLGILMVSRVHYLHVGDRLLRGRKPFMHLLILGLGLVLIILQHEIMLAAAFNGFALTGIANEIRFQLFPSHRPAEWIEAVEAEAAQQSELDSPAPPAEKPAAEKPAAPPNTTTT